MTKRLEKIEKELINLLTVAFNNEQWEAVDCYNYQLKIIRQLQQSTP